MFCWIFCLRIFWRKSCLERRSFGAKDEPNSSSAKSDLKQNNHEFNFIQSWKKVGKKKLGFSLVSLRNFSAGDCSRVEESLILTRANFTGSRCLRSRPHILPFLPQPSHGPNTINTYKYDLGFSMPPYDLLTVEREAVCFSSEATQAQAWRDDLSCGTSEVHDFHLFRKVYLSIA